MKNNFHKKMVVFALTLIRHGETGANKENVIQGQSDVPLSDAGLKQAHLLGQRLQNQKYTHVFASDLSRAKQTAETILDKSHYSKGPIIQESKLRERKFGEVEGKTFSELKRLARRANQTVPSFTPSGAETVQQVRQRAVVFFQELCQLLKNDVSSNPNPTTVKMDATSTPMHSDKSASQPETDSDINGSSGNPDSHGSGTGTKRRRHSSSSASIVIIGDENGGIMIPTTAAKRERSDLSSSDDEGHMVMAGGGVGRGGNGGNERYLEVLGHRMVTPPSSAVPMANGRHHAPELCVYVPSRMGAGRVKISPSPAMASNLTTPRRDPLFEEPALRGYASVLNTVNGDCPNVSLSPRVTPSIQNSWSTPSSDACRKTSVDSSNDEFDATPSISANVLIVSHGGLLRELIRHFVEDLGCTVPGGKAQALRISPNTGLSKFTVSITDGFGGSDDGGCENGSSTSTNEKPKVICLLIHDKDHLIESGLDVAESSFV